MKYSNPIFKTVPSFKFLLITFFMVMGIFMDIRAHVPYQPWTAMVSPGSMGDLNFTGESVWGMTANDCNEYAEDLLFQFCLGEGEPVPFEDIRSEYAEGVKFYNQNPENSEGLIEFTSSNPFPATDGKSTYYANSAESGCVYPFEIQVNRVTTTPIVGDYNICYGDDLTQLAIPQANTGADGKPYKLFIFAQEGDEKPVEVPDDLDRNLVSDYLKTYLEEGGEIPVGEFTIYMAEGYSSTCYGPKVPVTVRSFGEVPAPEVRNKVKEISYGTTRYIATPLKNHTLVWYDIYGNLLEEEPVVNLLFPGVHTAYVSQKNAYGCESEKVAVIVKVEAEFALKISKSANPITYSAAGQEIEYTIKAENEGNFSAYDVVVEDPLTGLKETITEFTASSSHEFSTTYVVTEEDIAAGKILNTAYATTIDAGGIEFSAEATATVWFKAEDDKTPIELDLKKKVDRASVKVGEIVTYTISLTNYGDLPVEDVLVTDFLPAELMFISASMDRDSDELVFRIPVIVPGQTITITIEALAIATGEVINTVAVNVGEFESEAESDPVVIREALVDLAITKTSNNVRIFEGDEFEYHIEVVNNGFETATDVIITDELPAQLTYISSSYTSDFDEEVTTTVEGKKVAWRVARFPVGGTLQITLKAKARNKGIVINEVEVVSNERDTKPEDNIAIDENEIKGIFFPNVITPGGDGKNDFFVIEGLKKFEKNNLVIFNRYGDHVFQAEDYENNWDARGLNSGTYFYVMTSTDAGGHTVIFKGWIQVITNNSK
jgi:uncharacterized repeat protein (TIGR01451 family)/gliding motility-associated-like protein